MRIFATTKELQRVLAGELQLANMRGELREVLPAEGGVILRFDCPQTPEIRPKVHQGAFIECRMWQEVQEGGKPVSFVLCKRGQKIAIGKWSAEDRAWIGPEGFCLNFVPTHYRDAL